MTLRVSGKNLAIGEALRTHVHSRIDGVVAKYHAGTPSGHVTIEPEGSGYRADCTLFLKAGITLQVEAIAQEPYSSFDKAADRIERRLRDHRKRLVDRHADGASSAAFSSNDTIDDGTDELLNDAIDSTQETFPVVVAEPAAGFEQMTVAAAVLAPRQCRMPCRHFSLRGKPADQYRLPARGWEYRLDRSTWGCQRPFSVNSMDCTIERL